MSILRVRLNKLSSDWHIARALLEDEYKAYIDKALNKIRTRYEFAAHLLDVHRMWCAECPHSGCLGVAVRSDRDTSAAGSAAARLDHVNQHGQQAGLQSDAPDMGLHAGLRDNNGVKQECHDNESSQEKDKDEEQREDDSRHSNLQDQIPETHQHLADVHSEWDGKNHVSDLHVLIKQEGPSQEHCDVDMDSSRNELTSQQRHEEGISTQHIRSDVQSQLDWTNHVSDLHVLIKQEGPSQERCNIDMDSSRNESISQQRHEEGISTQHIRSDLPCHLEWTNEVSDLQEGLTEEHCDGDRYSSTNQSTSQQRHEEGIPTQHIGSDGKTIVENKSEPFRSTYDTDECGPEAASQAQCDADGKRILHSNNEPSSSTMHYDERSPLGSSQDICEAGMDSNKKVQNTLRSDGKQYSNCVDHNKRLSCMSSYNKNLATRTCKEMYQRSECEERFSQKGHLKSRIRTDTRGKPHQCFVCDKAFTTSSHLSRHMRLHTGDKPHQCSVCNTAFTSSSDLSRHVRKHTVEKSYPCSVCNKAFTTSSDLSRHVRKHTVEKSYPCSVCNKAFTTSSYLFRHVRAHIGEKPYQCSVCNKTFPNSSRLSRHLRYHTGEKPYQCSECEKRFSQKEHLKSHTRTHTGEKPFQCPICCKKFSEKGTVNSHMRIHTGEKPHQCSVCSMAFNTSCNLSRHVRTHTRKKPLPLYNL